MAVTNADILGWFNANPNADAELINKTMADAGVSANQVASALSGNTDIAKSYLTQQILGQGTTSQWSGEGKGSAQANAADIANILSGIGITDISQFGEITKTIPAQEQQVETGDGFATVLVPERTVTTYGNKVTGQEVPNTYSERQVGNAFGGTYQGKGNTAYRVDMSSGTPVFYTTEASSKDTSLLPLVQMALMATGAGGLLGNAILGAGASQVAANALGGALLGAGTTSIAGGDAWKGALLGGAGGALGGALSDASSVPMLDAADTAGGLIPKYGTSYDDWMQLVMDNPEAQQALLNAITNQASQTGLTAPTDAQNLTTSPSVESVDISGTKAPITANQLATTLAQLPAVNVTAKADKQTSPDAINAINTMLSGGTATPPTVEVTAENPNKSSVPVITPINSNLTTTAPTTTTTTTGTSTIGGTGTTDTKLTTSDVIKLLGIGTTIAGINAATSGGGGGGVTQYPIVPIPSGWSPATATKVAPATKLPDINFGDRNLLIGTQWEKFLDPNYGQVPAPVQYSQPSNLSYNDLMGILGSKQGMPAKSSLSINDIISGIQNQYGQAPASSMG
jgi:hypothetical protein